MGERNGIKPQMALIVRINTDLLLKKRPPHFAFEAAFFNYLSVNVVLKQHDTTLALEEGQHVN